MDEIDAALDFKNVSIVANYIKVRLISLYFTISSLELCSWGAQQGRARVRVGTRVRARISRVGARVRIIDRVSTPQFILFIECITQFIKSINSRNAPIPPVKGDSRLASRYTYPSLKQLLWVGTKIRISQESLSLNFRSVPRTPSSS